MKSDSNDVRSLNIPEGREETLLPKRQIMTFDGKGEKIKKRDKQENQDH